MPSSHQKRKGSKKARHQSRSARADSKKHQIKAEGQECPYFGCLGRIYHQRPGLFGVRSHRFVCSDNPEHSRKLTDREISRMEKRSRAEFLRNQRGGGLGFYLSGSGY